MRSVGKIYRKISKGFAFVRQGDGSGGDDLFVHYSECPDKVIPPEGTVIEFTVGTFRDRPVVRNVAIVAHPEAVKVLVPSVEA